uniref:Uncharacterized protein n=1 Tax=Oryza barthii TaxID=65489 RepID=A0A0D3GWT3_9ORYZ
MDGLGGSGPMVGVGQGLAAVRAIGATGRETTTDIGEMGKGGSVQGGRDKDRARRCNAHVEG